MRIRSVQKALPRLFACLGLLAAAASGARGQGVELTQVASVASPTDIQAPHDGSGRLFITTRQGRIRIFNGAQVLATPFLDISSKVLSSGFEQGLLGLAFHPEYETNGWFYVAYTEDPSGATVVERYTVSVGSPNIANPAGQRMLTVAQYATNHNGGQLQFGPDGYLYVGLGDGGGGGDPQQTAQDLSQLLGKMLRLDVDHGLPYSIPPGNPFTGKIGDPPQGAFIETVPPERPEI